MGEKNKTADFTIVIRFGKKNLEQCFAQAVEQIANKKICHNTGK